MADTQQNNLLNQIKFASLISGSLLTGFIYKVIWTIPSFFLSIPGFILTSTDGNSVFIVGSYLFAMIFISASISFFKRTLISNDNVEDGKKGLAGICNLIGMAQMGLFLVHGYNLLQIAYFENFSFLDEDYLPDLALKKYYMIDCKKSFDVMLASILLLAPVFISMANYKKCSKRKMIIYSLAFFALNLIVGISSYFYDSSYLMFSVQFFRLVQAAAFLFLGFGLERVQSN